MVSKSLIFSFFAIAIILICAGCTYAAQGRCGNACEVGRSSVAGGCNSGCSCKMSSQTNYHKKSNRGVGTCQPSRGNYRARRSRRH
uniref:8 kDa Amblyomma family member n=1 Tax=Rhipicephalus zambeziensis TaxID=60191 RepID=A0A224YBH5_9ACAR